jgi:hypothetical protein
MKFCKDCASYQPPVITSKCHCEQMCVSNRQTGEVNMVTGEPMMWGADPVNLRHDPDACGPDAKWFEPANLDGRLAMLEGESK